jgi:Domain of unknown function (DUF4129)
VRGIEPAGGGSRGMRLVYVGVALTVLLGIVAFVSRGHTSPAGSGAHDRGASQLLANIVFTFFVLAMAAGALLFVYIWSVKKRDTKRDEFRIKPLLTSLLFFAGVLIAMVLLFNRLGHRDPNGNLNLGGAGKTLQKAESKQRAKERPHSPSFNWPLAAGLVALLVGISVTAVIRSHRRRSDFFAEALVAHELATLIDDTIDDLRAEADPRKAVIAAYARMERVLAAHGLPRRIFEAPLEYLTRVLLELRASEPSVRRLTELFERAKFSTHEIGPELKEEAIDALVSVRDDLRAINVREDPPPLKVSAGPPLGE